MLKIVLGAALGATMAVLPLSADAGTLNATWTVLGETASWQQSTNPIPSSYTAGVITNVPVWDATPSGLSPIGYFSTADEGGFEDAQGLFVTFGFQIYSGSEANPVFSPGSYTLFDGPLLHNGTLTFTLVPEPATWCLMLAGFAGLGAFSLGARRRARPA